MAAQQAFNNMSPDQRMRFGQYVEQQMQSQGMPMHGFGPSYQQQYQDPNFLAQQATQLHQQQPGLLGQLLGGGGGGGGGMLANPAAKAALAGIAATAISNAMGGKAGSPLGGIL